MPFTLPTVRLTLLLPSTATGALSNVYQELQRAASSGAKLPLPSLPEPEPLLSSVLKVLCPFLTFADAAQAMAPTITYVHTQSGTEPSRSAVCLVIVRTP
jgi:hypothetical protein